MLNPSKLLKASMGDIMIQISTGKSRLVNIFKIRKQWDIIATFNSFGNKPGGSKHKLTHNCDYTKYLWIIHFYFFEREYTHTNTQEGQREKERENFNQAPQRVMQGSILWPCNYDLSRNQESDAQPTEPPRRPLNCRLYFFLMFIYLFWERERESFLFFGVFF